MKTPKFPLPKGRQPSEPRIRPPERHDSAPRSSKANDPTSSMPLRFPAGGGYRVLQRPRIFEVEDD